MIHTWLLVIKKCWFAITLIRNKILSFGNLIKFCISDNRKMLSLVYAVLASGVKMFIYLFIIFIVLIWWSIKDYFNSDLLKNYSNKSLPLIKTSFKLALSSSGWNIKRVQSSSLNLFFFIYRRNISISSQRLRQVQQFVSK